MKWYLISNKYISKYKKQNIAVQFKIITTDKLMYLPSKHFKILKCSLFLHIGNKKKMEWRHI